MSRLLLSRCSLGSSAMSPPARTGCMGPLRRKACALPLIKLTKGNRGGRINPAFFYIELRLMTAVPGPTSVTCPAPTTSWPSKQPSRPPG